MKRAWVFRLVLWTLGMFLLLAISLKAFAARTKIDEPQQDNVTTTYVTDDTIVNADINSAAAIAYSKLNIADGDLTIAKTSGLQTALDGKLALAGGTMVGNLVIPNAGTVGQAAGPLLTFDDAANELEISGGNVGIGTTGPGAKLEVAGTAGTDGIKYPDGTLQKTAPGAVRCKLYLSGVQAVADVTDVAVLWDTEVTDPQNMHSTVTNKDQIVIPSNGDYYVIANIWWDGTSTVGFRNGRITVNGTQVAIFAQQIGGNSMSGYSIPAYLPDLVAGDIIRVTVYNRTK